jgi:hypothetical protein
MGRVATPNLSLGAWLDGDTPGAGSQTVDNTGLNGNFIKLDTAVGVGHTTAGAHKNDVIDGPNLKTTSADATTIELSGAPLKLRVKALGIAAAQLAAGAVTAGKIASGGVSTTAEIADGIISTAKLIDAAVTTVKLLDDAVTAAKISHDNKRTKNVIVFSNNSSNQILVNGVVVSGSNGICLGRAGALTGFTIVNNSTGAVVSYFENYATVLNVFSATDKLRVGWVASNVYLSPMFGGTEFHAGNWRIAATYGTEYIITLEVEFDD